MAPKEPALSKMTMETPMIWFPADIEEAWEQKRRKEEAAFIAGGTVIQMQREQGIPCAPHLISLENIKEMNGMKSTESLLSIGALTTLADCRHHETIKEKVPLLRDAIGNIAAPAVRNRATIGGNLMFGKGDAVSALLVLDASISYFNSSGHHVVPLYSFLENHDSSVLVTAVILPMSREDKRVHSFFNKVGRREAFSLSVINVAGRLEMEESGYVKQVLLAVGGADTLPQRLPEMEQLLGGSFLSIEKLKELYTAIVESFQPADDAFFSSGYKQKTAAHLIVSQIYEAVMKGGASDD